MLVAIDVDYRAARPGQTAGPGRRSSGGSGYAVAGEVVAACVAFRAWADAAAAVEIVHRRPGAAAPYVPGAFYQRELPALVDAITRLVVAPAIVIVDGHVWLGAGQPGLGAHLNAALGGRIAIVGVAKRPYAGATEARLIVRGTGLDPLYVSAIGTDVDAAATGVRAMHGPHRIPTLLRRVDRLARTG